MTSRTTVANLVPAYCAENRDEASAGLVRQAKVAHTMFFHECGCVAVQLNQLVQARITDEGQLVALLSESYSRAVFETVFARHFDRMDPHADELLLSAIDDTFGAELAQKVRAEVALRGVVLDRKARDVSAG